MDDIVKTLSQIGVVPVITIENPNQAAPLMKALFDGGIPCGEITFRTEGAKKALALAKKAFPKAVIGAGTVLTVEQAEEAIDAGADFIVSPGFHEKTVAYCLKRNVLMIPGCATPGEMERAMDLGLTAVKFFPAESAGGISFLKAIAAPYQNLRIMPTGGITLHNLNDYLSCPNVFACGGSFMVPKELLRAEDYEGITRLTRQTVATMLGLRFEGIWDPKADISPSLFSSWFSKERAFLEHKMKKEEKVIFFSCSSFSRAEGYFSAVGEPFKRMCDDAGQLSALIFEKKMLDFTVCFVK